MLHYMENSWSSSGVIQLTGRNPRQVTAGESRIKWNWIGRQWSGYYLMYLYMNVLFAFDIDLVCSTLWAPASLLDVHDMPAERITKFVIKKRVSVSSESKSECFFCHEKIVFYLEVNNCLSLFGYLHYHLPVFWLKQIILPNC